MGRRRTRKCAVVALVAGPCGAAGIGATTAGEPEPPKLESKIPLGRVRERIDHLAVDVARQRLFVAELGNNGFGIVDIPAGKLIQTISKLKEPQGVGYVVATDTVDVANAGDGSVHLYAGEDHSEIGHVDLGDDADNIRVDSAANRVFVGCGKGALAIIDPATKSKSADSALKATPKASSSTPPAVASL